MASHSRNLRPSVPFATLHENYIKSESDLLPAQVQHGVAAQVPEEKGKHLNAYLVVSQHARKTSRGRM